MVVVGSDVITAGMLSHVEVITPAVTFFFTLWPQTLFTYCVQIMNTIFDKARK